MFGALSFTSSIVMVTVAVVLLGGAEGSTGTLLLAVTVRVNDGFCSRSGGLATLMIPSVKPRVKNLEMRISHFLIQNRKTSMIVWTGIAKWQESLKVKIGVRKGKRCPIIFKEKPQKLFALFNLCLTTGVL